MNPQEARDFVRRKCIEVNPHILRLGSGCRVQYYATGEVEYWYGNRYGRKERIKAKPETAKSNVRVSEYDLKPRTRILSSRSEPDSLIDEEHGIRFALKWGKEKKWASVDRYGDGTDSVKYLNVEIIGRDIRLADVLVVLSEQSIRIKYRPLPLNRFIAIHPVGGLPTFWNLLDDSLDNQSPETWVALAEMLR